MPLIRAMTASGVAVLRGVGKALDAHGIATARGGGRQVSDVRNVLQQCPSGQSKSAGLREYLRLPAGPRREAREGRRCDARRGTTCRPCRDVLVSLIARARYGWAVLKIHWKAMPKH